MIGIRKNLKKIVLAMAIMLALGNAAHRLYSIYKNYNTLEELIAHQRHR